jgi:hypothetical protein
LLFQEELEMDNLISRRLQAGLIAAALMMGGAVIGASAQQPDQDRHAPQASPAQTMPGDNAQQPAAVPPAAADQDNGVRTAPNKDRDMQANPADRDHDKDMNKSQAEGAENSPAGQKEMSREVKEFDGFLDSHPEIAKDLQKDPSKINDETYVSAHPELNQWLKEHSNIREEIKENPSKFMNREKAYERNEAPKK